MIAYAAVLADGEGVAAAGYDGGDGVRIQRGDAVGRVLLVALAHAQLPVFPRTPAKTQPNGIRRRISGTRTARASGRADGRGGGITMRGRPRGGRAAPCGGRRRCGGREAVGKIAANSSAELVAFCCGRVRGLRWAAFRGACPVWVLCYAQ
jgi:hypothetical protein